LSFFPDSATPGHSLAQIYMQRAMQFDAQMLVPRHHHEFKRFSHVPPAGVHTTVYMRHLRVKLTVYISFSHPAARALQVTIL
jgi:hypothetical protein